MGTARVFCCYTDETELCIEYCLDIDRVVTFTTDIYGFVGMWCYYGYMGVINTAKDIHHRSQVTFQQHVTSDHILKLLLCTGTYRYLWPRKTFLCRKQWCSDYVIVYKEYIICSWIIFAVLFTSWLLVENLSHVLITLQVGIKWNSPCKVHTAPMLHNCRPFCLSSFIYRHIESASKVPCSISTIVL